MTVEDLRTYCLAKPATTESFPFDEETLVFKVAGKIYALISLDAMPLSISLKCDPERAVTLREEYDQIQPGFHLNKRLWNSVTCSGNIRDGLLRDLIDQSYEQVVAGLPKSARLALSAVV